MASLAAVRRAATSRLPTTAATTTTPRLPTATATATTSSPRPITTADTTTSPLLLSATAEVHAASTPLLLTRAATTTTTPLAGTAMLSTCFSSPATIHRRFFSTSLLGDGKSLSAPSSLATAGSRLARMGICTETLTPVVQKELNRIEKESVARHGQYMKALKEFELEIMSKYAAAKLSDSQTALTAGKVAWRVSTAVLAFGVTTLVAVLQVIKDGWKVEFQTEVKQMLEGMIEKLKVELLAHLRQLIRKELEIIEAEKAAAAKK